MVQLREFRIVMPLSLEEYQVAQMYMVMKMQKQTTTSTEGVDVLENKPFEDDVFGKGRYTSKIYRLQSKAPTWLTALAPLDALVLQEEAWNAYPKCKTVIKCPYFPKFSLTIETIHKADNGNSENVHSLSKEQLASRQVESIDIAASANDYWSYIVGNNSIDMTKFQSERTGRGPLLDGWQESCKPVMTAYKLVTVDAPYWGFGSQLEQAFIAPKINVGVFDQGTKGDMKSRGKRDGERALFHGSHRNIFAWIDEWFGVRTEVIRKLEKQCISPFE